MMTTSVEGHLLALVAQVEPTRPPQAQATMRLGIPEKQTIAQSNAGHCAPCT